MASDVPDDEPVFCGVRLEQHAGVSAAIAEDIAIVAVLDQEGIAETDWKVANPKWRQAIADSPDLQTRYIQKRRQAEDCLARPIRPLDEDPIAFAGLLAAVNRSDDARSVLGPLGLRVTDLARLGRLWTRRAENEPEIQKRLAEQAGTAQAPKSVRAEPVVLKPFPWTKGATADVAPAPPSAGSSFGDRRQLSTPVNGVLPIQQDVDLYAALAVVLQLLPEDKARILPLCGLDDRLLDDIHAMWRRRLEMDADLNASFVVRAADHRTAFRKLLAGARGVLAG